MSTVSSGGGVVVGTGLSKAEKPTVASAFGEPPVTSILNGYGSPVAATYIVSF